MCNGRKLLLVGDFNFVLNEIDRSRSRNVKDISSEVLAQAIIEYDLVDVAECLNSSLDVKYTHCQGSSNARLDRIFLTADAIVKCSSYQAVPVSFSDHCLVKCLKGTKKERNSFSWDQWKMNSDHLDDETFNASVKEEINNIKVDRTHKIGEEWELLKQLIKNESNKEI